MSLYSWPYPHVLAHRGGGSLAPENTLAALKKGLAFGYLAVEFDVMLSADEVPVLMHDPLLGRTVTGRGSIADLSAAALTRLDAGRWFGAAYAGEPVPLYEDVVRFCRQQGIWMNVELKPVPGYEGRTGAVVAALTQRLFADEPDLTQWPLFSSFQIPALEAARGAAPEIAQGWLVDRIPDDWQAQIKALGCVAMDCNHRYLDAAQVAAIKTAGYGLLSYTVNDPERARELFAWGVDALCTDRIDLIAPQ
jgi:glycerophosphoryl diester phosphodiesterase